MEVGRVRRPHGVRGAVLVEVSSDVPERFAPGSVLELTTTAGERRRVEIEAAAPHGDVLRLTFAGVSSREEATLLRGATLEVSRELTPTAPDGEFYYFELAGCECVDRAAGLLGTVSQVLEDGGGLLLEVDDGARKLPVPFVQDYIRSVDVARRRIDVELPEGFIDACAST